MENVHILRDRRTRTNHAYVSLRRQPPKLDGSAHTICAKRLDKNFQHRPGNYPNTVITCDVCSTFIVALDDLTSCVRPSVKGEIDSP